jgi:hypothetical protein
MSALLRSKHHACFIYRQLRACCRRSCFPHCAARHTAWRPGPSSHASGTATPASPAHPCNRPCSAAWPLLQPRRQLLAPGTAKQSSGKKVRDRLPALQAQTAKTHLRIFPIPRTVRLVFCQVTTAMSAAQLLNPKAESRVRQVHPTFGVADWGRGPC